MIPIYRELESSGWATPYLCCTGQHLDLIDDILNENLIIHDINLGVMVPNQTLAQLSSKIIAELDPVIRSVRPMCVLVHGDTTTTFAASYASFLNNIKVCHVEAGLRSHNILSPWPEEANRKLVSILASYHYAPSEGARSNLIAEGVDSSKILVTGNTAIDGVKNVVKSLADNMSVKKDLISRFSDFYSNTHRILVTLHRRENQNENARQIASAIKYLAKNRLFSFLIPLHPNPKMSAILREELHGVEGVTLTSPVSYTKFICLMQDSFIILTDSGGIQEEAPYLNVPVLVLRTETERPEAVSCGACVLAGHDPETIITSTLRLLDVDEYNIMSKAENPYGDGTAASKIVRHLRSLI